MALDLATVQGFFQATPFMVALGVEPTSVGDGRVSTQLTVKPQHQQHTGVVHAGVLAALADHTMGAAAQTLAPEHHWVLTAEFKVNLLRGAKGDKLVCDAWVIKHGRQLMFTEAEVYQVSGAERQLVVKVSGTMAVVRAAGAA